MGTYTWRQIAGSRCVSMSVGSFGGLALVLSHGLSLRACLEFDLESMDTFGKAGRLDSNY